jgi:acylphosphatase
MQGSNLRPTGCKPVALPTELIAPLLFVYNTQTLLLFNGMEEIECTITGRVQLVMFRDFSQRMAKRLGVLGNVKNLEDGTVRVVAQGEKGNLEKYIKLLKKGSILAKVENIETVWRKPSGQMNGFRIIY